MKKILAISMFVLLAAVNVVIIANGNEVSSLSLSSLFKVSQAVAEVDLSDYIANYEWGDERQIEDVCGMKTINGMRIRMWEVTCGEGTDECAPHSCF